MTPTVDEAREALLSWYTDDDQGLSLRDALDAFEAAIRAESAETLAALREAHFDEYGINVVEEALSVAIASPSEMEVNRKRWATARVALLAALAATPAENGEGRT